MLAFITALTLVADVPACGPRAEIAFAEGSPVDRFQIVNRSPDGWSIAAVEILLAGSNGALVFDVAPGGAGRNVSRPFRPGASGATLSDLPLIEDGADRLALAFDRFPPGERFSFSIDLDDGLPGWGTTVEGAEIDGATATVTFRDAGGAETLRDARFGTTAAALADTACLF